MDYKGDSPLGEGETTEFSGPGLLFSAILDGLAGLFSKTNSDP